MRTGSVELSRSFHVSFHSVRYGGTVGQRKRHETGRCSHFQHAMSVDHGDRSLWASGARPYKDAGLYGVKFRPHLPLKPALQTYASRFRRGVFDRGPRPHFIASPSTFKAVRPVSHHHGRTSRDKKRIGSGALGRLTVCHSFGLSGPS
jgi:hypothetical protein